MKITFRGIVLVGLFVGILGASCAQNPVSGGTAPPKLIISPLVAQETNSISTSVPITPQIPPTATLASVSPTSLSPIVTTAEPQLKPTEVEIQNTSLTQPADPCAQNSCVYSGQFFLERPIASENNNQVDVTYRFGSTQGGTRDPHHGVEFLNGFGTPVLAAGDGKVVVAGDDINPISPAGVWPPEYYGPYSNFFGNLVVLEHQVPDEIRAQVPDYAEKIYTLYGHLSEILVSEGDLVQPGQEIGRVGVTGVSTGSHLHFEVRVGQNKYENSRNPELWLMPQRGEASLLNGGFAGRVIDLFGVNAPVSNIVLEYLPDGPEGETGDEIYLLSYEEAELIDQPPFKESFGVGDIAPGLYRISFPLFGRQEFLVEVQSGLLTVTTFEIQE